MDAVNDYLKRTLTTHSYYFDAEVMVQDIRPRMRCADGFSISVQASFHHYCIPQIDGVVQYKKVELGFPSMEDSLIIDYAEDPDYPTGTVYGCVPIDVVNKLIEKHGGIVN